MSVFFQAVRWLRGLVTGLSPRTPGFDHGDLWRTKRTLEQASLRVRRFSRQYRSTNAGYWSLSPCCFYWKNKRAKSGPSNQAPPLGSGLAEWQRYIPCEVFSIMFPHADTKSCNYFLLFLRLSDGRVALNPYQPNFFLTKRKRTHEADMSVPAQT